MALLPIIFEMTSILSEGVSNLSSSQVFVLDVCSRQDYFIIKTHVKLSRINSLDFFHNGEHLVAGNDDGTILLIDPLEGRIVNKFYSKKFGISNICWVLFSFEHLHTLFYINFQTHHPTAIVGSSTLNKFDCMFSKK